MTPAPARVGTVLLGMLIAACGSNPAAPRQISASDHRAGTQIATTSQNWPTYHGDLARSGALAGSTRGFGSPGLDWVTGPMDGDVYASPIVAGGLVLIATENDTVYAFDAASGHQRWSRHLGQPVDASTLACGNIRPVSGITGTPVADAAGQALYVVAFVRPAQHVLYTLDLASGVVRGQRRVDPPGDSPLTEQQRAALTLAGDIVYVSFGGLFGDCGAYHGWVVAAPITGGDLISYQVPCHRACGLWAPGGPTVDEQGDLWVSTGNSDSTSTFDYGNAVLRLSPDLKLRDWFAPSNWAQLNSGDQDLGSISPALLEGGLAWISGKDGTGYLLRRDRLGHIRGQAFSRTVCPTFGSSAYAAPMLYLSCSTSVVAVRIDPTATSFTVSWRQSQDAPGGPILAFGALWVIDTGNGTLAALDPVDGHRLYSYSGGKAMHFVTPAAAGNHVYAALDRKLVAVAV